MLERHLAAHLEWHLMLDRLLGHTLTGACEYVDMTAWMKYILL